jgi:microcystin-dependent protein
MGVSVFPAAIIPAGLVMPYAGSAVPDGWLACNGQEVAKLQYPALWAAFGQTHMYGNPVDPTNNFLLPNLKGKAIVHIDGGDADFNALGKIGGSKISTAPHTHDLASHAHTLGGHTHSLNSHTHTGNSGGPSDNTSDWYANPQGWQNANADHWHGINHWHTGNIGNTGYNYATAHAHHDRPGFASEAPWEDERAPGASIPLNIDGTARGAPNGDGASGWMSGQHQHGLEQHNHGMKNHFHTTTTGGPSTPNTLGPSGGSDGPNINTSGPSSAAAVSGNLQPYMVMTYLIKY